MGFEGVKHRLALSASPKVSHWRSCFAPGTSKPLATRQPCQNGYDNRGNLLNKTVTQGSGESWSNAVNANNQLSGTQGYDDAGNFTSLDGVQYNYFNAENQWTSQSTLHVSYLYDGDGRRVMASGGASGTRVYWYDVTGNVIEEDAQNGTVQNEYLYLRGQRIARVYQLFSGVYYYYGDNLGTSRVLADENGNKCYDADYFPWGGEQYVFTNTCSQNYKFTSKERDPDMGIDDFGARFYKNTMARFYSPDWSATVEPVPYAKLNNPQSLNLYTYVLDNPLSFRDADGHEVGADTLQELQKITSDSGNAAQNTPPPPPAPKPPPMAFVAHHSKLAQYLAKHIPGFSVSKFNGAVGNMRVLEMPTRTGTVANMTQGQIGQTGSQAGTKLGSTNTISESDTAVTFTNISSSPILLGPNFFTQGAADQQADMVHEEIHAFTGASDAGVANMLQLPAGALNYGTGAISDAIKEQE